MSQSRTPALDDVIERMDRRVEGLRRAGDRRERLLLMCRTFQSELRRNLREGRFRDPEWSEAICCRMAEMYFEADEAYRDDPTSAPDPWALCFDSAVDKRTNLLQDMLLGMNAHINHDLPLCTYDVMERFGDTEEPGVRAGTSLRFRQLLRRRYYDFLLINEIAWESLPLVQDVVCQRFNRLLKYANLLSFGYTRHVAERLICEYRDRGWAHTLVLLTLRSERGVRDTQRHLSRFALRTAGPVERITINPLRHVGSPGRTGPTEEGMEPVARVLIDNLGYRPTRGIARQALEEYGTEVQPILIRTLDQAPPLAPVRAQLYRVLAAEPTDEALAALARSLDREKEKRGALLRVTAEAAGCRSAPALRQPALSAAAEELAETRRLLDAARPAFEGSFLGEVLANRIHRGVCRIGYALRTADVAVPDALMQCEFGPRHTPPVSTLRARLQALLRAAADAGTPLPGGHSGESSEGAGHDGFPAGGDEALAEEDAATLLVRDPDPWIRTFAAWWIGTAGRRALASSLVDRIRRDPHELVKETALVAAARLLSADALRKTAAALLERPTYAKDTPARRLANEIEREGVPTMITNIEKVRHLKNVELFQDVLAEDLVTIGRAAEEYRFGACDRLIEQGTPGEATYVIVEGEVEVRRDGRTLATVGPGAVLGEMSVVSDLPTAADCVAATEGVALRIARTDFHVLLQDYPTTAIGVMRVLAQRLRDTDVLAVESG